MSHAVHPIEAESYRILRARVDLSHLPALTRAVAERVVHASADLEYAGTLLANEDALRAGREALLAGAPLVCDTRMVAGGITRREATVPLLDPRAAQLAAREGITRTAAAMRLAVEETGAGAVWVVGNAPTALFELLERPPRDPALIVGLPVGFVGAAEAKAALAASGLPCVANRGEKGGSAVAAAAVNALLYFDEAAP
ncbi:MAG TPA: precorrin-8X methylmutase [Solirubrobacteraceae bacterium]|nr:precorrin-8X methylmutase [Solirubrobacteraceae bacterium]